MNAQNNMYINLPSILSILPPEILEFTDQNV